MCQEKYSAAEPLYRQALEMRQKLLGTEHPEVATSINNLAFVLYCQEKYELAERLFTRALLMSQKLLGIEHPDVAGGLNNLALSLDAQGNYEAAEIRYRQALAMRQKLLGAAHPDVATTLNNLAFLLIRRGQFTAALPLLAQAAQIEDQVLRATSSETRMTSALSLYRDTEDTIYGLLLEHADNEALKRLVMTTALLRKGRAAEAGTLANRLLHQSRGNPLTKQRFEQWQRLRQQRESLLYGNGDGLSPVALQKQLRSLSQQADDQESQLAAAMPKRQQFQPPAFDDILPAVARRLPEGGRLFEVVWAKPFNYKSRGIEDRWRAPHYVALEITADQQIAVYDLGVAATLDRQVQTVLDALRNPSSDPKDKAKALYDQILKPLLSPSMKHVYLSLDGSLNLVPFDALHDGTDYLLGRRTFHYLTSGRDLLRTNAAAAKQAALLIADPDFGQTRPNHANSGTETFYQRLSSLNRLAGAQQEAKRIGDLLHVAPFVGSGARESIIRAVQSPWIVHIASHGLFLNSQDVARAASRGHDPFGARKLVPLGDSGPASLRMTGDVGSLSRSALVLAGATRGAQAKDAAHDGLLTAEEARSLNLFGTQLVVLSACETGQGELSVGQGVYGLRRAFLVAGAETLVTSLWQVNDIATGRLMELYYQQLLKKRKGRLEGMQEAMKEMRAKYPHPYYWAPFLVIGNDGPLRPPGARLKRPQATFAQGSASEGGRVLHSK
jgi:CHAT domain-containing protein